MITALVLAGYPFWSSVLVAAGFYVLFLLALSDE
jgi:hypothetical protein